MHRPQKSLLLLALSAALLLAGATPAHAQRRGGRRAAPRDIPNATLALTLPAFGFRRRQGEPALLFNWRYESVEGGSSAHDAAVFAFVGGRWIEPRLPGGGLGQSGWTFVGRLPNRPEFWAVSEIDVAGPGWDIEILSTRDGAAWSHSSIKKVSRFAEFDSFHMSARGVGAVTVVLSEDYARNERPAMRAGYYTYATSNRGRTWSRRPRFSAVRPPAPARPLERPDFDYDDSTPPGAARLREILRELSR